MPMLANLPLEGRFCCLTPAHEPALHGQFLNGNCLLSALTTNSKVAALCWDLRRSLWCCLAWELPLGRRGRSTFTLAVRSSLRRARR